MDHILLVVATLMIGAMLGWVVAGWSLGEYER
jgi:hypothetical protein